MPNLPVTLHSRVLTVDASHERLDVADAVKKSREMLVAELRRKVMDLELALLHSRDFAIGAIAETGQLRHLHAEISIHNENLQANITRLEAQALAYDADVRRKAKRIIELERIAGSRTFKVGRLVMLPVRILKRLAR